MHYRDPWAPNVGKTVPKSYQALLSETPCFSYGIFGESYASCGRVANVIPVDAVVPGPPPPPTDILRGILSAVRRGIS